MQVDNVALVRQVQGLACQLGDALEENERLTLEAADLEDDADDYNVIRGIVARELGGPIADPGCVERAFAEARDELRCRPRKPGATIHEAGPGTLGRMIVDLPEGPDVAAERGHEALVALHRIYALVRGWGPLPNSPLPEQLSPADVLVEVQQALTKGPKVDQPWARGPVVVQGAAE